MALVNWDKSLSVEIKQFDQQHIVLFDLINELHNAMMTGKGKEVIGKTLQSLIDYTESHFKDEEKYFVKFSYPEKDKHVKEHTDFVKKVVDFKNDFEGGKLSLSIEVLNFLNEWLQKHIKVTDKRYSDFFHSKGLL